MENQLTKVTVQNDQQLVSARELHEGLGLKKKFTDWVKQNFREFEEGIDYEGSFISTPYNKKYPDKFQTIQDYASTTDMAEQLCSMSRTEKGKEYRKYLTEVERKWNGPQEIAKRGYTILQNENIRLKLENARTAPKTLFVDTVAASKTDILMDQSAKTLCQSGYEIGQNKLFKWLREHHYLCAKGSRYNQSIQRVMDLGSFRVKEKTTNNPDGSTRITVTTLVTGKGQQYFVNRFLNSESDQSTLEIEK